MEEESTPTLDASKVVQPIVNEEATLNAPKQLTSTNKSIPKASSTLTPSDGSLRPVGISTRRTLSKQAPKPPASTPSNTLKDVGHAQTSGALPTPAGTSTPIAPANPAPVVPPSSDSSGPEAMEDTPSSSATSPSFKIDEKKTTALHCQMNPS